MQASCSFENCQVSFSLKLFQYANEPSSLAQLFTVQQQQVHNYFTAQYVITLDTISMQRMNIEALEV